MIGECGNNPTGMAQPSPATIQLNICTCEGVIGDILVNLQMSIWRVRAEISARGFLDASHGSRKVVLVGPGRVPMVLSSSLSTTLASTDIKQGGK